MLVFDFDGVLVDSRLATLAAYSAARTSLSMPALPELSGVEDLPLIYTGLLTNSLHRWVSAADSAAFWTEHARLMAANAEPYPMAPPIVAALNALAAGPGWTVVSGAESSSMRRTFLANRVAAPGRLYGRDLAGTKTEKLQALRGLGATHYVGDTGSDMKHAAAAGLIGVGVTCGFASAADIVAGGARLTVGSVPELCDWIARHQRERCA